MYYQDFKNNEGDLATPCRILNLPVGVGWLEFCLCWSIMGQTWLDCQLFVKFSSYFTDLTIRPGQILMPWYVHIFNWYKFKCWPDLILGRTMMQSEPVNFFFKPSQICMVENCTSYCKRSFFFFVIELFKCTLWTGILYKPSKILNDTYLGGKC